jgi:putative endonuclease
VHVSVTLARQHLGELGETLACAELESQGYAILARRWRGRHGEIDIVAEDGDTLVFVEVRMKASAEFGTAAESVTRGKQRRVARMALEYLLVNRIHDRPCRFDVVAIDVIDNVPRISLIRAAFDAM